MVLWPRVSSGGAGDSHSSRSAAESTSAHSDSSGPAAASVSTASGPAGCADYNSGGSPGAGAPPRSANPQTPAAKPQPPAANPGASPAPTPPAAPAPPPTVYGGLALNNASLTEVIDLLAQKLKINYILDPRVKGGVILNTYGDVKDIDTRSLLETILRINGFGMVKQGDLTASYL